MYVYRHLSVKDTNLKCFTYFLQLDKLRKGEGLRKDEDQTRIANTYDPDDIKGEKSNKRRQKEKEENDGRCKRNKTSSCLHASSESIIMSMFKSFLQS